MKSRCKVGAFPREYATVDAHNHVWPDRDGRLDMNLVNCHLKMMPLLGIEKMVISAPVMTDRVTPAEFRKMNAMVREAMDISDRFIGFVFVDPNYPDEAAAEIEHCVKDWGFSGIKLYHQQTVDDPRQEPIMSTAARLGIPVLMHAGKVTDPGTIREQPRISNAQHFLNALECFPDTIFMQGHIGGGGDWFWNLRVLRGIKSDRYFIDIGGSVCDSMIVRKTIEAVGIDRVLFATDMSIEEGVGKLYAAKLSPEEMKKVCSGNWNRIAAMKRA
ncbi:MAG: amidohydrolase family protein [Victivallales bacterium]|nr:amidohydrolase family protein [Victivallales bacterium]